MLAIYHPISHSNESALILLSNKNCLNHIIIFPPFSNTSCHTNHVDVGNYLKEFHECITKLRYE